MLCGQLRSAATAAQNLHTAPQRAQSMEISGTLSELAGAYKAVPNEWLLLGHCLLVSSWYRSFKDRYLLCYWVRVCKLDLPIAGTISAVTPLRTPIWYADRPLRRVWRWDRIVITAARPCQRSYCPVSQQLFGHSLDSVLVADELLSQGPCCICTWSAAC